MLSRLSIERNQGDLSPRFIKKGYYFISGFLDSGILDFWIQVENINFEDMGQDFCTVLTTPFIVNAAISYLMKLLHKESKRHETCMHNDK